MLCFRSCTVTPLSFASPCGSLSLQQRLTLPLRIFHAARRQHTPIHNMPNTRVIEYPDRSSRYHRLQRRLRVR